MSVSHEHNDTHDVVVKKTITIAAKRMGIARNVFHSRFTTTQDDIIARYFWLTLWDEFPDLMSYKEVDYCSGCKKFTLY